MSGSFPALNVQVPDIGRSIMQADAIRANRLQMLAQQQQLEDSQAFRQAAPDLLPALATAEGPQRQNILAKLAGLGERGAGIAIPMMQQERERAQFQQLMGQTFGTGAPGAPMPPQGAPVAPQGGPAPSAPMSAAPEAPAAGGPDVRRINVVFAQRRAAIMDDANLSPEQQSAALATLSAQHAAAIGAPSIPNGYRANPGFENAFVGTRPPSGVVPGAAPGAGAAMPGQPLPQGPAGGTNAPVAAAPQRQSLPTPDQLFQLAASGNPQAMAFVQRVAPLIAQANPGFQFQNIGGTLYAINPRDPNDRRPLGMAGDGPAIERVRNPDGSERLVPRPQAAGLTSAPAPDLSIERVRQADGTTRIVPRAQAAGMTEAPAPPDTFGRSNTLRDEFTQLTRDYRTIQTAYDNIQVAARSGTGQGDMSMLYQFVKLLDPTSVVRESEFAMAAQTGAVDERVAGWVQRILTGERLPDNVRQGFLNEANSIYQNQRRAYDRLAENYTGLAQRSGLDPQNVVTQFAPPPAPPPPAPPPGGRTGGAPIGQSGMTAEPPARPQPRAGVVRVQTPEEALRLAPGTTFIDPNGVERIRP